MDDRDWDMMIVAGLLMLLAVGQLIITRVVEKQGRDIQFLLVTTPRETTTAEVPDDERD